MPKAKSAIKQARSSQRKRLRNQSIENRIRSGLRQFHQLLKSDPQNARTQGRQVVSWLDRASKSKVIHPNNARRHKTRIMAQMKAIPAAAK
jgi:small subunit ribosomal protein S20